MDESKRQTVVTPQCLGNCIRLLRRFHGDVAPADNLSFSMEAETVVLIQDPKNSRLINLCRFHRHKSSPRRRAANPYPETNDSIDRCNGDASCELKVCTHCLRDNQPESTIVPNFKDLPVSRARMATIRRYRISKNLRTIRLQINCIERSLRATQPLCNMGNHPAKRIVPLDRQ